MYSRKGVSTQLKPSSATSGRRHYFLATSLWTLRLRLCRRLMLDRAFPAYAGMTPQSRILHHVRLAVLPVHVGERRPACRPSSPGSFTTFEEIFLFAVFSFLECGEMCAWLSMTLRRRGRADCLLQHGPCGPNTTVTRVTGYRCGGTWQTVPRLQAGCGTNGYPARCGA